MSKVHKDSRYVRKTKRNFENMLLGMLEEKNINRITVKELADNMEVSRSTFYAYYDDVYSLLGDIEDKVLAELCEMSPDVHDHTKVITLTVQTFDYMKENEHLLRILTGPNGSPTFIEKLKRHLSAIIDKQLKEKIPELGEPYSLLMREFLVSGAVGFIRSWINLSDKGSSEEMVKTIDRMFKSSMEEFLSIAAM